MNSRSLLFAAAAVLGVTALLIPSARADIDRTHPPKAGPFPELASPNAISETLPNGLRVFILPDSRQPTVTYRLLIKSGSLLDGDKPGRARLTANLLNKGTPELSAEEFARKTDFLGAQVEASAGEDSIAVVATGLSRDRAQILGFLRDAALRPAFRQDELDKQKIRVLSELAQAKADPEVLAARLRNRLLYGEHPYGAFATPESVHALTREDLAGFHSAFFVPNNATLAIVGDVDPQETLKAVREAFGGWEKHALPASKFAGMPELHGVSVHLVDRPASVQSNVVVAGRGVPRNDPDIRELSVVNSVLGGGFSGRLFGNLREKHAYTYGSYSSFDAQKLGGVFSATAEVRNAVTGAAITEILNELRRITAEPIPENELRLQRNYLAGNFLLSLEKNSLSAERLQAIDLYGLPKDYYSTYPQRIMSVTPERGLELARKDMDPKNLVIVVVGNAREVYPQLSKLGPVTVYDMDLQRKEPAKSETDSKEK